MDEELEVGMILMYSMEKWLCYHVEMDGTCTQGHGFVFLIY
jgi:hypothetical protein